MKTKNDPKSTDTRTEAATEAPSPAPAPPPNPLQALEEQLDAIGQAHARSEEETRQAYIDLLARLLPPRGGPAPAQDAHSLAVVPQGGPLPAAQVLGILRAASKTPDDVKRDVKLLTELRDRADLAAQEPELERVERAANQVLEALREEWKKVEAEWSAKLDAERARVLTASSRRYRANQAVYELERDLVAEALRNVRSPLIMELARATPEQLAAKKVADDECAALQTQARTLSALDQVFFPPPPKPRETAMRVEGCSWTYHPRA